ncbi:hypothetical protein A2291_01825 [candidate division WOR-1 bacterium RIFOXYB2_FULL_42_35]|uniref:Proline dehydrogenase domain-containing protein n=1 Tax=candidate division WOR-1 bacterium RIFOXYC2_FULL_41_25 TaxID=1802586 RepID=A0A1F4TPT9_UNCSA|nr:MAG: hypothetical protein A2247_03625 [candidate division WOR-1 bacterium RIFOXYA2_FULL_41_14]OGC25142.1 MAG: hypothetical protein A2291_01825 [candidate division WOR-1 bacterium RIFOXYB2_FULL_42_35]OGC34698.1 MAG: hypothetical protein A2462_03140 [candidate division WOR-1 bacterium RIFOXYC2_FULL_41_25]OGC41924.1 MAG: hypothetical protein A2548_04855 [candidate division WOR-1 bacterium RIFOXYD2_FULL_41_8]
MTTVGSTFLPRVKAVARNPKDWMHGLGSFSRKTARELGRSGSTTLRLWENGTTVPIRVRGALGSRTFQEVTIRANEGTTPTAKEVRAAIRHLTIHQVEAGESIETDNIKVQVKQATPLDSAYEAKTDAIMANIPKPKRLSFNFWRGKLAKIVMADEKLIPKFEAVTRKLLDLDKTDLSTRQKAQQLSTELKEQFPADQRKTLPKLLRLGFFIADILPTVFYHSFKILMKQAAKLFIGGENIAEANKTIERLAKDEAGYVLDFVAEEATTAEEAEINIQRYLASMDTLAASPERVISVKLTGLVPGFTPEDGQQFDASKIPAAQAALLKLVTKAKQKDAVIIIDMERYSVKDATLDILEQFHAQTNYQYVANLGVVIQTYLKDSLADTELLNAFADRCSEKTGGEQKLAVRFVKGAYQVKDKEHVLPNHEAVNQRYVECVNLALDHKEGMRIIVASHNPRTISECQAKAEAKGAKLEYEMLLGMPASPVLLSLAKQGNTVRFYLPVGSFEESIGYFMRRMVENANSSSCQKTFTLYYDSVISLAEYKARAYEPVSIPTQAITETA